MAQDTSTVLLLSESLTKIRNLINDKDINNLIQDKQFFKLCEMMAEINRNANVASGLFFSMHIAGLPKEVFEATPLPGEKINEVSTQDEESKLK